MSQTFWYKVFLFLLCYKVKSIKELTTDIHHGYIYLKVLLHKPLYILYIFLKTKYYNWQTGLLIKGPLTTGISYFRLMVDVGVRSGDNPRRAVDIDTDRQRTSETQQPILCPMAISRATVNCVDNNRVYCAQVLFWVVSIRRLDD